MGSDEGKMPALGGRVRCSVVWRSPMGWLRDGLYPLRAAWPLLKLSRIQHLGAVAELLYLCSASPFNLFTPRFVALPSGSGFHPLLLTGAEFPAWVTAENILRGTN